MRRNIRQRLDEIETRETDFIAKLDIVDYDWILDDYSKDEWQEVHVDGSITVVKHRQTGEVRGIFADRRSDYEIRAMGGDLAYL